MSSDAKCAHQRVEYRTKDVHLDGQGRAPMTATVSWWACDSCDERFVPAHALEANGVATVEELEQLGLIPPRTNDGEPEPTGTQ